MNAKMIEAMEGMSEYLIQLIEAAKEEVSVTATATKPAKEEKAAAPAATKKSNAIKMPVKDEDSSDKKLSRKEREAQVELPEVTGTLSREQLDALPYNKLKQLAKEMGIPAIGARDELTEKIMNTEVSANEEDVSEEKPKTSKKSAKAEKAAPKSKAAKKVEEPEEDLDADDDDDEDDEEEDPIVTQVNEATEDMTDEEILEILLSVGIKAKGKRQALIAAVLKAVREGLISLGDDEDEDEESDDSEDTADSDDDSDDSEDDDSDDEEMTEERAAAIAEHREEVESSFSEGELDRKSIIAWLNEFNGTKDNMKKVSDDDLLEEYIKCSSLLISDEGVTCEDEGTYYNVNGVPFCCGHALKYNKKKKVYICETCGTEFETE